MMSVIGGDHQVMVISSPQFDYGQLLEWSIDFESCICTYQGYIEARCWVENGRGVSGIWEYVMVSVSVSKEGHAKVLCDYDTVAESELSRVRSVPFGNLVDFPCYDYCNVATLASVPLKE